MLDMHNLIMFQTIDSQGEKDIFCPEIYSISKKKKLFMQEDIR